MCHKIQVVQKKILHHFDLMLTGSVLKVIAHKIWVTHDILCTSKGYHLMRLPLSTSTNLSIVLDKGHSQPHLSHPLVLARSKSLEENISACACKTKSSLVVFERFHVNFLHFFPLLIRFVSYVICKLVVDIYSIIGHWLFFCSCFVENVNESINM